MNSDVSAALDMSQFMDIVTTFKCKACTYVCSRQEDLMLHIKTSHLTADTAVSHLPTTITEEPSIKLPDVSPALIMEEPLQPILTDNSITFREEGSLVQQINIQTIVDGTTTDQVVLVESTGSQVRLLTDSSVEQRELFLCGQCSAEFDSMDDCKVHMCKEHNAGDWTLDKRTDQSDISNRLESDDGRVSIGTQMEKKKPGRKPKSETLAAQQQLKLEQDEEEHSYGYVEEPGKRKRRVPSHLRRHFELPRIHRRRDRRERVRREKTFNIKCDQCRARFEKQSSLEYHMKCHSSDKGSVTFVCPETTCEGFSSLIWTDLKMHAWKTHKIDLDLLQCDLCKYKTTVHSKLQIHKETHSEQKPYKCDVCPKSFKQAAQLKNHALLHMTGMDITEKESMSGRHWFVQAQCDICKRTFANQKSLACHIEAVHDKVKPFKCQFCGHTAARKAMMQLHLRTHTGEKPFTCDLCEYTTGDHNSLRRHRMRHSGEKPYQCPHCPYACIQAVSLKLHLKSKHPGSQSFYSCSKCHYRTVNKVLYANHERDHEMGLIDEGTMPLSENSGQVDAIQAASHSHSIKLGPINDLTNGSSNTTQLIISALNAVAPSFTENGETIPDNIETTVHVIPSEAGMKTHRIMFHIPACGGRMAKTAEVLVQEQISNLDTLEEATLASDIPTSETSLPEGLLGTETNDSVTMETN